MQNKKLRIKVSDFNLPLINDFSNFIPEND